MAEKKHSSQEMLVKAVNKMNSEYSNVSIVATQTL